MPVCPECDSLEFTEDLGLIHCASCGVYIEGEIDGSIEGNPYKKENEPFQTRNEYFNTNPRLRRALKYDGMNKQNKSDAHKQGLAIINDYQSHKYGGKEDYGKNRHYDLIKQAIIIFEKGIKKQAKTENQTGTYQMFMPSGLSNSPLYAAYSCILYAERQQTGHWDTGLTKKANHISDLIQLKDTNGNKIPLTTIMRKLSQSYKRLDRLIGSKKRINRSTKSLILKNNFIDCVNLYTQKVNTVTSDSLLEAIARVEFKLNSEEYRRELELEIPNTGFDLVAAEILYKIVKSTNSKITRKSMMKILNGKKRMADKQRVVEKIFLIIEL